VNRRVTKLTKEDTKQAIKNGKGTHHDPLVGVLFGELCDFVVQFALCTLQLQFQIGVGIE
jgi:hypothetical protein